MLCCLSYENDQYRQMKAVMPKLGQTIETPGGMGQVVSMQLLKELVTVRLEQDNVEATFRSEELGLSGARQQASMIPEAGRPIPVAPGEDEAEPVAPTAEEESVAAVRPRRRRRGGRRPSSAR